MFKKIILFVLLVFALLGYFLLDSYAPHSQKVFSPVETYPIAFDEESQLHFFEIGFSITNSGKTVFFDYASNPIEVPIEPIEDGEVSSGIITDSTNTYIVIDDRYLYNTTTFPFEYVLEIPQIGAWDIKEFKDSLLIVAESDDKRLYPYIMDKSDSSLHMVEGLGNLSYLDSDFSNRSNAFSIITLDRENPIPSSKILHFTDAKSPYGVLSIEDEFVYGLHRYEDFFLVLGLHSIKCYDMIGDLKWEVEISNLFDAQTLTIDNSLAFYFNNRYIEGRKNTMIITDDGKYDFISMERGIHSITKYKSHYIGVKNKDTLVILSSKGDIAEKYEIGRDIQEIYWTPYSPDIMFFNIEDEICIYSIESLTERSED